MYDIILPTLRGPEGIPEFYRKTEIVTQQYSLISLGSVGSCHQRNGTVSLTGTGRNSKT